MPASCSIQLYSQSRAIPYTRAEAEGDSAVPRGTEDADLQMALQLSREDARPASRDSMDDDLQLALARSRSEADEAARKAAQAAQSGLREQGDETSRAGPQRSAAVGGQHEVLVLDSSDGSEEDEPPRKLAKRRRLKHR